ncbi:unnamed protein product [Peronospora destructor]|uniref:Uncharacterized protein n=1 Tax=Peronospora destructor TaxID=86335 RepID=A0AAV0T7N5_9STRA|nr:unnamed protein product [Peronospora destructor]
MPNSNRGLIGLPLKPVQSRNALALSAIQEERASLDIVPQATAVATTTSSSPCGRAKCGYKNVESTIGSGKLHFHDQCQSTKVRKAKGFGD